MIAAIRQPARMIGLRPIRSESQPKKMKKGVASAIAISITTYASLNFTPSVVVMKVNA